MKSPMKYVASYHTVRNGKPMQALAYYVGKGCIMSLPTRLNDGKHPSPAECVAILRGASIWASVGAKDVPIAEVARRVTEVTKLTSVMKEAAVEPVTACQTRMAEVLSACRPLLAAPVDACHAPRCSVVYFAEYCGPTDTTIATLLTALCSARFYPVVPCSILLVDAEGFGTIVTMDNTTGEVRLEIHHA